MTREYEAPTVRLYGTLAGVTGSVKCTPGTDSGYHGPMAGSWYPGQGWWVDESGNNVVDTLYPDYDKCKVQ